MHSYGHPSNNNPGRVPHGYPGVFSPRAHDAHRLPPAEVIVTNRQPLAPLHGHHNQPVASRFPDQQRFVPQVPPHQVVTVPTTYARPVVAGNPHIAPHMFYTNPHLPQSAPNPHGPVQPPYGHAPSLPHQHRHSHP